MANLDLFFDTDIFASHVSWSFGTQEGYRGDTITDSLELSPAQRRVINAIRTGDTLAVSIDPDGKLIAIVD